MSPFSKLKSLFGMKKDSHKSESIFINDPRKLYFGLLLAVDKVDYSYVSIPGINRPMVLGTPIDFDSSQKNNFSCYTKTSNNTYVNIFNKIEVDYADIDHMPMKCQEHFKLNNFELSRQFNTPIYYKVGLLEPKQLTEYQIQRAQEAGIRFSKEDIAKLCSFGNLEQGLQSLINEQTSSSNYEK